MKTLQLMPVVAALAVVIPTTQLPAAPSPEETRLIAKEAYIYGYPLVECYRAIFAHSLSAGPSYKAPFNAVPADVQYQAKDRTAITPNIDVVTSAITYDLRTEPYVLTVPAVESTRYNSVQFVDLYTHNFDHIGTRTTGGRAGNYLIVGPNWNGPVPPHVVRAIRSETEIGYVVLRTQIFNDGDYGLVKGIHARYKLQPYSRVGGPQVGERLRTTDFRHPLSTRDIRTSPDFFAHLAFVLRFCPPHPTERDMFERFARIGIVPGSRFDIRLVTPEIRDAMIAGMQDGQKEIDLRIAVNRSLADLFGTRETLNNDYLARAAGAQLQLFGASKEEIVSVNISQADDGSLFDGDHAYTIRFGPGELPPAASFWSLTMYNLPDRTLVQNSMGRHVIQSPMLPDMKRDADGGLTIYVQHNSPGDDREANWLPAPKGPFWMVMRVYRPRSDALAGDWVLPMIARADLIQPSFMLPQAQLR